MRKWINGIGLTVAALLLAFTAQAAEVSSQFKTLLTKDMLDGSTFAASFQGKELTEGLPAKGAAAALWTSDSQPDWIGMEFAGSKQPGMRHLRIGFKQLARVGTILTRSNGKISVLKATARYPGRLEVEDDWIPAERISSAQTTTAAQDREDYALWVLPQVLNTRAVRVSHDAQAADASYAGWLGGALVLPTRMANVAPLATASTSANAQNAKRINNESTDGWAMWENVADTRPQPVSQDQPEWITLTWPAPVKISGLCTLFTGFSSADVQLYSGPADRHPRDAAETDWKTLATYTDLPIGYPLQLYPNWMDFGKVVTTRAVRLRITKAINPVGAHPHMVDRPRGGKYVWVSEVMALHPLASDSLQSVLDARPSTPTLQPPIPVRFSLAEPGYVTLVIDDASGVRVRNLVSAAPFPAGENVVYWDGSNDLLRDNEAAGHGIFQIPTQLVAPGSYRVNGLFRKELDLRYEFSVYDGNGTPPWETADKTGGWLTNHTPAQASLFIPAGKAPGGKPLVYLGSYVSEGGAGLAWVDPEGKKQGGRGWVGGNWTAAPYLARDAGAKADNEVFAYVASAFSSDADQKKGEIRLTGLMASGDKAIIKHPFEPSAKVPNWASEISGLSVNDGVLVVSLTLKNQLLFVDAKSRQALGTAPIDSPRGTIFDTQGRLLVLAAKQLFRYPALAQQPAVLGAAEVVIKDGLDDPQGITIDPQGLIYISDRGASHQVKVFDAKGAQLRVIGKAGLPKAGPYDPEHMNNPRGLTVDNNGRLWVAEEDYQPKRVSVWTPEGKLWKAFYGPSEYGGGGGIDPMDKTRFYYFGMEFKLDWEKGTYSLASVLYRPMPGDLKLPDGFGVNGQPQTSIYLGKYQYLSNCHTSNPTGGSPLTVLWQMRGGLAIPVAALGQAQNWPVLKTEEYRSRWPQGVDPQGAEHQNGALFAWSDLNVDGKMQPAEVEMIKGASGGITVMNDLTMAISRVDGKAMAYAPRQITPQGVPVYDLAAGKVLAPAANGPASSGGDQVLLGTDGWTICTNAPKPFAAEGLGGVKAGKAMWSYPSLWPGLHASHVSPAPENPGQIIGTTRLIGGTVTPANSNAGPLWAINGNHGNIYMMTQDGLFVARLFQDMRQGKQWKMPTATRNMPLNDVTLHDENFWPSITQTADGNIYIIEGARSSVVRVDGLGTLHRLPPAPLQVTQADLDKASSYFVQAEIMRQQQQGQGVLNIALRQAAPTVDGKLEDWASASWVDIDKRGVAAYFDSNSKPYNVTAAMAIAKDRLYVAYKTGDAELLRNSGEVPNAPFKTGGVLDVMIATDPSANPGRANPVAGDQRLLVTKVGGKTKALLYRAVVPGTKEPVPFSSPWRTVTFDQVVDVSAQVELAGVAGDYELSVPLSVLGLKPAAGLKLRGDVGILRGDGTQTTQRVYWSNKATAIVADVPSEAMLMPSLWGSVLLTPEKPAP